MAHHLVIKIAYDGSSYFGWQKTQDGPSIEEALSSVLERIFSEKILLRAASRTDRGVHANGQIVDFFCTHIPKDLSKIEVSINQLLPPDIRCLTLELVPFSTLYPNKLKNRKQANAESPRFDFEKTSPFFDIGAVFSESKMGLSAKAKTDSSTCLGISATSKIYRYYISPCRVQKPFYRHTHWHMFREIDIPLMKHASTLLIGEHDFRGLCNSRPDLQEDTIRTLYSIDIFENPENEELYFEIHGNSFLYKMVRNIVGTLVYIGTGKLQLSSIEEIISSRKRARAGVTAPAHGLTLWEVRYPGFLVSQQPSSNQENQQKFF